MNTYLEKRWGGGGKDPSESELLEALAELQHSDPEHPDCWLSDENGWTIAAHETGRVVLENPEGNEGPRHVQQASHELIMTLWRYLQAGAIDENQKYPWREGY